MNYSKVYAAFTDLFPEMKITKFTTNRMKNTITLEDRNHKRFLFTYNGPDSWRLQTMIV